MIKHYIVIWELLDGLTQDESESMPLEEAIKFLGEQAVRLNGEFNWIQIEPEND